MAYLIDATYFNADQVLPNISGTEEDVSGANNAGFDFWINTGVIKQLEDTLGCELFEDLNKYVDPNTGKFINTEENPAPQKWIDLVEGKKYTRENTDKCWKGLLYEEQGIKRSLLTYYVYKEWLFYQQTQLSGFGQVAGSAANSSPVDVSRLLCKNQNTFVKMYQGSVSNVNIRYPEFFRENDLKQYLSLLDARYSLINTQYVSMVQFILDNIENYSTAELKLYSRRNLFSL